MWGLPGSRWGALPDGPVGGVVGVVVAAVTGRFLGEVTVRATMALTWTGGACGRVPEASVGARYQELM